MKSLLGILLGILPCTIFAQSFEFETIRTEESPGFFAIQLFPKPQTAPIPIQDIFVKNYTSKNEENYADLILVLNEFGTKVIEPESVKDYQFNPLNRLVYLGKPKAEALNFQTHSPETAMEDFEKFATENLGHVFFQNVQFQFGGNIHEVFPKKINFWGEDPILIVGKFEKPMRTLAEIIAVSNEGEVVSTSIIDLRKFIPDPLAETLPDLWEEMNAPPENTKKYNLLWVSAFPWIVGITGGIIILLIYRGHFRKRKKIPAPPITSPNAPFNTPPTPHPKPKPKLEQKPEPQSPPTQPTPPPKTTTPSFSDLEKTLPFEVEKTTPPPKTTPPVPPNQNPQPAPSTTQRP